MPAESLQAPNASPTAYRGRFAPSPTGPLHAGSLLAALASYLDARAHGGRWLLRIEDVDRHRNVRGATDAICRSLQAHGLHWDGEVVRQTDRDELYERALQTLANRDSVFYCNCTRKVLRARGGPYPGYCRGRRQCDYVPASRDSPASHAIRFDTSSAGAVRFADRILGPQLFDLEKLGDFIIRRRDSLFAYQLAVVVDDHEQGVTDVVRGADLLDATPWQIALQQALDYPTPRYAHLPLLLHQRDRAKLSKQTGASAVDDSRAAGNLLAALARLGQVLPEPSGVTVPQVSEILDFAVAHWSLRQVPSHDIEISE